MKLGIIISSGDAETIWQAFRLANYSRKEGDDVRVYLVTKAVEYEKLSSEQYPSREEATQFIGQGGHILACTTCMRSRHNEGSVMCEFSSLKELHTIIKECDKIVCY